ncbi:MAG: primosomal protein N' [Thermodesulfobacteria bacterium]|nr:primosomal protein N' [Thermodesulfobacteriota bacterium]
MYLVEVVVPLPLFQTFFYISDDFILPGIRVVVPFKNQKLIGIVKDCKPFDQGEKEKFNFEVKEIEDVVDSEPIYPPELFSLLEWVADYYVSPLGLVFQIALPPRVFSLPSRRLYLTPDGKAALKRGDLPECFNSVKKNGYSVKHFLKRSKISSSQLTKYLKKNWIKIEYSFPEIKIPQERFLKFINDLENPNPEQERILEYLKQKGEVPEKILRKMFNSKEVTRLLKLGAIERTFYPKLRKIFLGLEVPETYTLTSEQKSVVEGISTELEKGGFCPILLFGVTGSGKSFVYLEVIKKVLAQGKRVLILVPEIALTTYMELLLLKHFKEELALLHSGLSVGQRFREWEKLLKGEARIAVGTRSAIFAPITDLGLIIVDEEHDPSYKEENLACKYNARDLALVRGKLQNIPVILGSATPSIKSYYYAKQNKYKLFTLKSRPYTSLPKVKVIKLQKKGYITKTLQKIITKDLMQGKSVFLYLNRRGYSPLIICEGCGYIWMCPNCGVSLTYHKEDQSFRCHYCEFKVSALTVCPECKGTKFKFQRAGTEKIEEEIKTLFPDVEVIRLDRDSVSTEAKLTKVLEKIYQEKPKIIVGTQMGVHGHNFPGVDTVGVLRAEEGLFMPFYKATERTFALLVQAAGRAGRRQSQGMVVFQTSMPDHYVIRCAIAQDYENFYRKEIELREKYLLPPFSRIGVIKLEGVKEDSVQKVAEEVFEKLKTLHSKSNVEFLGPAPCPFYKLKGLYRWHILIKSKKLSILKKLIKEVRNIPISPGIRVSLDVDPEELV